MATPDLSNIPTEDLQHIAAGDMTKVSEPVLRYLSGQPQKVPSMGGPVDTLGAVGEGLKDVGKNALETIPAVMTHAADAVLNPAARLGAGGLAVLRGKDYTPAADAASAWLAKGVTNPTTPVQDPVGNAVVGAVKKVAAPVVGAVGTAAQGIENAADKVSPGLGQKIETGAGVVNDAVGAAPLVGGIASAAESLARPAVGDLAGQLGFRTANTPGRVLAGKSAGPTLGAHNSEIGTAVINHEAGIANGTTPSFGALEEARAPANAVMDRTAAAVPAGPLSTRGVQGVESATSLEGRVTQGSPEVQNRIAGLREQLLNSGDRSGQEWLNEVRGLRQEGFADLASGDTDRAHIGRARIGAANAIEDHLEDSIPANADVDMSQFQDARRALAKNATAQAIFQRGGVGDSYDLSALARMHQDNPGLFDGDMKTAAEFASSHPDLVTPPGELEGHGVGSDIGNISLHRPSTYLRPLTGALGRRLLTGGGGTVDRLNAMFQRNPPNPFEPLPTQPVQGPPAPSGPPSGPWSTAVGAAEPAAPGPGGIPLADLLSHGVERPPEPGLTAGPMGAPAPQGIPFTQNAGHLAGDLELAPQGAGAAPQAPLGDLAGVMSQGVPESIAQRTAQPGRIPLGDLLSPDGLHPAPRKFTVNKKGKASEE